MAGCATCLHKNVHPNVCSDCLGGTHFKPRIKTNADRIRAMTDEELAKDRIEYQEYYDRYYTDCGGFYTYEEALAAEIAWLQQPAERSEE